MTTLLELTENKFKQQLSKISDLYNNNYRKIINSQTLFKKILNYL